MNLRGLTSFPWLLLLSFTTYNISVQAADDEDFIPSFFSGRRNNGEHAGMDPPPSQIMATKHKGVLPNVKTFFMKQKLDHNNQSSPNISSWRQRYLVNDDYFNPNRSRPIIFIRVGGESTANETDLQYGRMVQLAKRHRALLLELEHRYYGESKPMRNLKTKNLVFLSHRQALADLERLIHRLKLPYLRNGQRPRVILYGCSYAGSLAAYHRMLYPNSTAGAFSVCSPLTSEPEYRQYMIGTQDIVTAYDSTCWRNAIMAVIAIIKNLAENKTMETKSLNLCEPKSMDNPSQLEWISLYYDLTTPLMRAVQYNRMSMGAESNIAKLCTVMKNESIGDIAERLLSWMQSMGHECLRHDAQTITSKNHHWNGTLAKAGTRQWLYQMCSEFGYFSGMAGIVDLAGMGVYDPKVTDGSEIRRICNVSFGIPDADDFDGAPWTNQRTYFPGLTRKTTRVFFIHGGNDPWSRLGVYETDFYKWTLRGKKIISEEECRRKDVVVKTPLHSSHCEEPTGAASDLPDLVQTYDEANKKITEWIASA